MVQQAHHEWEVNIIDFKCIKLTALIADERGK
jgi:hypothetical protein